ncbi:hypothetical protein [Streptomyces sp. NPDC058326]|uniref:hypothetical protein n=1 Tax=Streptomyces sp. NPDC058326 TaxID=3346447 RepID=UPI0036E396C5
MTTTPAPTPDEPAPAAPAPTPAETSPAAPAPAPTAPTPAPAATAPEASPAPYTFGLRLAAAGGLVFLLACLVFTAMVTLSDAVEGDGTGGVLIAAGFWAVALGAVAGVAALVSPRRALVTAQYCLGAAGPLLALMD